jgi:hypothetical protein
MIEYAHLFDLLLKDWFEWILKSKKQIIRTSKAGFKTTREQVAEPFSLIKAN